MNTTNEPIDLSPFCFEAAVRFDLGKPFVCFGYKIATDGKLLVAFATDEPDSEGNVPRRARAFLDFDPSACTIEPLPLPPNECKECGGSGELVYVECDECDGEGVIECGHCYHESDCDNCNGNGRLRAKDGEAGETEVDSCDCMASRIEIMPGVGLMHYLAKKLLSIPGVRLSPVENSKINFVADGGVIGCFMEMT